MNPHEQQTHTTRLDELRVELEHLSDLSIVQAEELVALKALVQKLTGEVTVRFAAIFGLMDQARRLAIHQRHYVDARDTRLEEHIFDLDDPFWLGLGARLRWIVTGWRPKTRIRVQQIQGAMDAALVGQPIARPSQKEKQP